MRKAERMSEREKGKGGGGGILIMKSREDE